MVAAGLPFLTAEHIKMGALTREGPAIVQRPNHPDIVLLDISEQGWEMDTKAVQVVQVQYIRLKAFQFLYQLFSADTAVTAISAKGTS